MSLVPLQGIRRFYQTEERSLYTVKKKNKRWYKCHTRISNSEKLDVTAFNQAKKTEINKIKKNVKNDT